MLSQDDLQQIQKVVELVVDIKIDPLISDIVEIKDRIKYLPTKDEFFERELEIYGRLQKIEEAVEMQSGYKDQLENHEDRLGNLESHLVSSK